MNNTATNTATCPTVRKQIGKTTYIVRVHFSETAKETMEDKIKRLLREEVRKMWLLFEFDEKVLDFYWGRKRQHEDSERQAKELLVKLAEYKPLAKIEKLEEQNYNMIDERLNNGVEKFNREE